MARYRLTLTTSQLDNSPVPELARAAVELAAEEAADYLGEDVVFDSQTGVRTAGERGQGVATPVVYEGEPASDGSEPDAPVVENQPEYDDPLNDGPYALDQTAEVDDLSNDPDVTEIE